MPRIDVVREVETSKSARARQLEGLFDVPRADISRVEWHGDLPIEGSEWSIGLIVGPSGAGKSSILQSLFGNPKNYTWNGASVIDDFDKRHSMTDIAAVCQAVGFNTIPNWLRPYRVLSNGERFRVDLARRLIDSDEMAIMDEFTSVVDRQVAQIGSHAVQKYIRKKNRRFVAATCHYDIIEWLQPDWVFEPASMKFTRRSLQRRPELSVTICRVPYSTWEIFAPFHYLTRDLSSAAARSCFGLFVNGQIASFAGLMARPISARLHDGDNIWGVSRLVTLPDWQGLGLAPILCDTLGAIYRAANLRVRTYPAHLALVQSFAKSPNWKMTKPPGEINRSARGGVSGGFGSRPCATFEYCGAPHADKVGALNIISGGQNAGKSV